MTEPMIGKRKVSWKEAISFARQELKLFDRESIGIAVSSLASHEDAYLAARLAKVWGIKNIVAASAPADLQAYQGVKWEVPEEKLANFDDIENSEALLIIGDILTRSPVLSKRINKVKYGKRSNKIIVIDPNKTHTTWFATTHLECRPGTEAPVLAAMIREMKKEIKIPLPEVAEVSGIPADKIKAAVSEFCAASSGTIIFVPNGTKERNDLIGYFAKIFATLSPGKKYITNYLFGNTLGVNIILDREIPGHSSYPELIKKIESGAIKAMIILGEDISGFHPEMEKEFKRLRFVVRSDFFYGETPLSGDNLVTLPQANQFESGGSFMLADGRIEKKMAIVPQVGAKPIAEIAAMLMGEAFEREKVGALASEIVSQGIPREKAELKEKLAEVSEIVAKEEAVLENITHFGSNRLVKNFLWHRVHG
jgi:formate dehydrogenase major subunit